MPFSFPFPTLPTAVHRVAHWWRMGGALVAHVRCMMAGASVAYWRVPAAPGERRMCVHAVAHHMWAASARHTCMGARISRAGARMCGRRKHYAGDRAGQGRPRLGASVPPLARAAAGARAARDQRAFKLAAQGLCARMRRPVILSAFSEWARHSLVAIAKSDVG